MKDAVGAALDSPATRAPTVRDPRVSVVVTNWNYGHFLGDCLDSVLDQTRRPDQLIVVDDASTDGSPDILAAYADRAEIVRLERNRGQAAAFNAGFARATGDFVLFLDADDLLRPDAIDVLFAHAAPHLALVFFGLETIDADGRSTGVHCNSLEAEDGDTRPTLLRSGVNGGEFRFAPTSGNLFHRAFLTWALPMPEEAWRVCADAYLVRAAALWGPFRAVRRVLGGYRVHGGNNYVRSENFGPWTMQRGERDLTTAAPALLALAEAPALADIEPETAALRLALRLRALETLASVAAWTGDTLALRRQARRGIAAALGLPTREAVAATALLVRLMRAGPGAGCLDGLARAQRWAKVVPPSLSAAVARLEAGLARWERPRWLEPMPHNRMLDFQEPGPGHRMLADGWSSDRPRTKHWSRGDRAALAFALEPALGSVSVELTFAMEEPAGEAELELSISDGTRRLWRGSLRGRGGARFSLERDASLPLQPVRLEILSLGPADARFAPESLIAWENPPAAASPFLQPGAAVPAATMLGDDPEALGWTVDADGGAILRSADAQLHLTVAPGETPVDLLLILPAYVPAGWLSIYGEGAEIFAGRTGGTSVLQVPLAGPRPRPVELALTLAFTPSDPADAFALEAIGAIGSPVVAGRPGRAVLNVGEVVRFEAGSGGERLLLRGWQRLGGDAARSAAAEATLGFRVLPGLRRAALRLALAPALPPPQGHRHVVGISAAGAMLQTCELLGPGEITVPLGDAAPAGGGEIAVTVHSIHAPLAPGDSGIEIRAAPVILTTLALDGESDPRLPLPEAPASPYARPALLRLAEEAAEAEADGIDRLAARRAALAEALWCADQRALDLLAARPARLRGIERLGAAAMAVPLSGPEQRIVEAALTRAADPASRLRVLVASMLLLPAFKLPFRIDLAALPAVLIRTPDLMSVYLGRAPEFATDAEMAHYVRYLGGVIAAAQAAIDRHPPGSALHVLAARVMADLWSTKAIFGRENLLPLIEARSRCIETLLVRGGARLAMPVRPRPCARLLRVGVMVRHLAPSPETWALLGMYRGIDRMRLDLTLITTNVRPGEVKVGEAFARRLSLAGLSEEEAVAAIRALDFDVFILGAYTAKLERVSTIVAHRLARIQASACFNCPTTLGFRSFDHAFAWGGVDVVEAQCQHSERLVAMDAPLQCCFDFSGVPAGPEIAAAPFRRALGLPDGAVLLTSGAMAHKIMPELMEAWARILAASPEAWLLLYPFAACWAMPYGAEAFRRTFARHLEAAGVAPGRALILDEQPPERVRQILAVSDLYLDSFPYAGATTVCEALAAGVPVVTRTGAMLRERTGAAWACAYGLDAHVARDTGSYVDIAVRLATCREDRQAAAARVAAVLATGRPPHADSARFGAALSDLIWQTAEASGLFPGLRPPEPGPAAVGADAVVEDAVAAPGPASPAVVAGGPAPQGTVRVVVLTVPRSGSTALCHILGQCAGAEMHFELFHATEIQYRTGPVADDAAIAARDEQPVAFLDAILADAEARGASLVGLKFFAFHKKRVLRRIIEDERFRIVCLTRSNTLAQYASRRIAEATDQWELAPGETSVRPQVRFDPADFEAFEAYMHQWTALISQHLAEAGRQALFVEYATLFSEASMARLSDFVGRAIPRGGRPPLVRQNPGRILDRFSNPEELRRYLDLRRKSSWAYGG